MACSDAAMYQALRRGCKCGNYHWMWVDEYEQLSEEEVARILTLDKRSKGETISLDTTD